MLTFKLLDMGEKNMMIKLMKENSRNYVDHDLTIVVTESSSCVVVSSSKIELNIYFFRDMRCQWCQRTDSSPATKLFL